MQTTNERMTEEQLTDLLNLAAELQAKAEASNDRDTAVMAYAVQKVCVELTESRLKSKASEQQLAAVVAECASVKAMNDCLSEELRGYESDGAFEGPKMHLLWWQCETPATDAYLAEVRAQGVELFAERKNNEMMSLHPDTHAVGSIAAVMSAEVKELREFAAQLRQGAAI